MIELLEDPQPASQSEIDQLDQGNGIPTGLSSLLRFSNGGMPARTNSFIDRALLTGVRCSVSLEYLLDIDEISETKREYSGRINQELFPFGDDGAGNYICIGIDGKVYFWDHEHEGDPACLISIAQSLVAFIDLLGPEE